MKIDDTTQNTNFGIVNNSRSMHLVMQFSFCSNKNEDIIGISPTLITRPGCSLFSSMRIIQ